MIKHFWKRAGVGAMVFTALFVLCGVACNGKSANRLSDHGSTAETSIRPAAVNDSILWFENMSAIELKFEYDGLIVEISGTAEGANVKYSNLVRIRYQDNPYRAGGTRGGMYGALATYDEDSLEIRIDMGMWQDILKRLFNSGIREWGKFNVKDGICPSYITILDCVNSWSLDISNRNSEDILVGSCDVFCENSSQPGWPVFYSKMSDIIKNIIKIPLDTAHKERFGTPISEFEQSVVLIEFEKKTIVLKRMDGAITAINVPIPDTTVDIFTRDNWLTLGLSDWLDILHALGNGICLSNEIVAAEKSDSGKVRIEYSTEDFEVEKTYLPTSDELKKIMANVNFKIESSQK